MVACLLIGCSHSGPAADHRQSGLSFTSSSQPHQVASHHHQQQQQQQQQQLTPCAMQSSSSSPPQHHAATGNSVTRRHLSSSSSCSAVSSTAFDTDRSDDCSNGAGCNNNNNAASSANNHNQPNQQQQQQQQSSSLSSAGSTTSSSGRRHGKRQKGQPYIPSYMDLSSGPEPCVVCGDAATGYHYRAMTCEGCKGFFRRTVQKSLKYDCKFGGGCSVDKRTRNQCQQCRYIRCLTVGMAADLVLNEGERLAKRRLIEQNRERRKTNSGSSATNSTSSLTQPEMVSTIGDEHKSSTKATTSTASTVSTASPVSSTCSTSMMPNVMTMMASNTLEKVPSIHTLMMKHHENDASPSTSSLTVIDNGRNNTISTTTTTPQSVAVDSSHQLALTGDEQALIDAIVASYSNTLLRLGDHLRKHHQAASQPNKSWRQLTELLSPAIVKVVEFAKMLPGFAELDNADQVLLLRSGCIEVLCLRVASRPSFKSRLQLARQAAAAKAATAITVAPITPSTSTTSPQQEKRVPSGDENQQFATLIEPIIEFSSGISKLSLDTTETALLAAVLLMQSDRSGLHQPDRVEQCQDRILSAYRKYVCQRRPEQPVHWAKILMKVTDVRAISLKYSEKVLSVSVDDSPAPELPSLVLELLYDDEIASENSNNATLGAMSKMTTAASEQDHASCASGDEATHVDHNNQMTSGSSYVSSRSPFTSSDMPSSPMSYAESSSSGSGGAPSSACKAMAAGGQSMTTPTNIGIGIGNGNNATHWHPASPDSAASIISSSSGSGRSAVSPCPPQQQQQQQSTANKLASMMMMMASENNEPNNCLPGFFGGGNGNGSNKTSPQSASFALHQLASIALDPMFYRREAAAQLHPSLAPFIAAASWPGAAMFLPGATMPLGATPTTSSSSSSPPTNSTSSNGNGNNNNNPFYHHQQLLAAAAAAAAMADHHMKASQQTITPQQTGSTVGSTSTSTTTTTTGQQPKPVLKSKYSISSLIA